MHRTTLLHRRRPTPRLNRRQTQRSRLRLSLPRRRIRRKIKSSRRRTRSSGCARRRRTTRSLKLSEAGQRYAAACRRVLIDLEEADMLAGGERAAPRGTLTISAPPIVGEEVLRPILDDFLNLYPAVSARLLLLDRFVNLVDEGVDIALRIGHLADSSLISTRIGGDVRRVVRELPVVRGGVYARADRARLPRRACAARDAGRLDRACRRQQRGGGRHVAGRRSRGRRNAGLTRAECTHRAPCLQTGCIFATVARDRSPHRGWRRATGPASRNGHVRVLLWPPPYIPYRAARRSGCRAGTRPGAVWRRGRARQ